MLTVALAACCWISTVCFKQLRGGSDQVAGSGVQCSDLIQDQLLVSERLGDDDGSAQG